MLKNACLLFCFLAFFKTGFSQQPKSIVAEQSDYLSEKNAAAEQLLQAIEVKKTHAQKARQIHQKTENFIRFVNGLKAEIVDSIGGKEAMKTREVHRRDVAEKVLIESGKAEQLRQKIVALISDFEAICADNQDFVKKFSLPKTLFVSPTSTAKSWAEFKFKNMPVAGVLPILGQMQAFAKFDEVLVLEYLNSK